MFIGKSNLIRWAGLNKEEALNALKILEQEEVELLKEMEALKEEDPYWFYVPSSGDLKPEALALLERHVKPEDMPKAIYGAWEVVACDADILEMSGGNRAQKTVTSVILNIVSITGEMPSSIKDIVPKSLLPDQKTTFIRHYGLTNKSIEEVLVPAYKYWMPKKYWHRNGWEKTYNKQEKTLRFYRDGSTFIGSIGLWSYEQDPSSGQGSTLHRIAFDEYPLESHFNEAIWRMTTGRGIKIFISATPTEGLGWVAEKLRDLASNPKYSIRFFEVPTVTNPYVNLDAVELALANLEYDEKLVRLLGQHRSLSGFIYKGPSRILDGIHIIDPIDINYFKHIVVRGLDPHASKETCCVEAAIDREGNVFVIGSYFEDADIEKVKADLAERVVRNRYRLGWTCYDRSLDYEAKGYNNINIVQKFKFPPNPVPAMIASEKYKGSVDAGIDKIKEYLKINERTGKPRLFFFNTPEVKRVVHDLRTLERDKARNEDARGKRDKVLELKKDFHAALRYIFQQHLEWIAPDEDYGRDEELDQDRYV